MSDLPSYIGELEDALLDLPDDASAMTLSQIDGYVAGLSLLPVEVPSGEWLPAVWRSDPATPDYLYHDQALLGEIAALAERHFRMVARELHWRTFEPIYEVDDGRDQTFWEFWIAGFSQALDLRHEALDGIKDAPAPAKEAYGGLLLLSHLAETGQTGISEGLVDGPDVTESPAELADLSQSDRKALIGDAPDLIANWVHDLYDWTRTLRPAPDFAVPVRVQKTGRNDPCPCGSGRKHKKCCGVAA